MKIGILTFFRFNYGAILQAYALQTVLTSLGHSAEIIDYEASHRIESLFTSWTSTKGVALNLSTILRYRKFIERNERIAAFRRQNLHVSEKRYYSSEDLEKSLLEYDAFICGSDQVWHPRADHDCNRAYFLGFVKQDQAIKTSYAPSFGVSSVSQSFQKEIQPWLTDIPNLSVREETGRAIIEQVAGRLSAVVLDPTLLLKSDQWGRIAAPSTVKPPYILVYTTSQRGLFPQLVKHVKKTTRLPLVVLSLTALNLIPMADRVIYDAGPSEFVGLFANATCVCTNSFHGTAFSIIYRKPFWSVPHNATNSRVADLLNRIGLSNRQVSALDQFPEWPLKIDYTAANSLFDGERRQSIVFLKTALQQP
ncbi:MAG: polysaccharide pyruvyl transferase family protein [Desulfobacterales bacterium]|jgi:hypothetical protein|nr:polysaccharide pyruvyl transferase family protein [Desulfobacterales bacterium]